MHNAPNLPGVPLKSQAVMLHPKPVKTVNPHGNGVMQVGGEGGGVLIVVLTTEASRVAHSPSLHTID